MFISRRAYQDLQNELIKLREESKAQLNANRMLEATMNWFRHRITQIEAERAQLIHHALGVKIPAPVFEKPINPQQLIDKFSEMDIFKGLSDSEAIEQGVSLDDAGRLVHTK